MTAIPFTSSWRQLRLTIRLCDGTLQIGSLADDWKRSSRSMKDCPYESAYAQEKVPARRGMNEGSTVQWNESRPINVQLWSCNQPTTPSYVNLLDSRSIYSNSIQFDSIPFKSIQNKRKENGELFAAPRRLGLFRGFIANQHNRQRAREGEECAK